MVSIFVYVNVVKAFLQNVLHTYLHKISIFKKICTYFSPPSLQARILTSLNDANLLRVLGVCFDNEIDDDGSDVDLAVSIPIGMVCEYTEEGDLCQYLQG